MKKFISSICIVFILSPFCGIAQIRGTITDPSPGGNTVSVYGKNAGAALTNVLFLNINLTISIPDQTLTGGINPTEAEITKVSSIPNLNITPATNANFAANPYINGGRAYYSYILNDNGITTTSTWPANSVNNHIADFTFLTNTFFSGLRLDDLSPNGGPNQQMYWYVNVIGPGDLTDYANMFYGVTGLPPTNNGGVSESFVQLQPFSVLPVNFSSFEVFKKNNSALVTWSVDNEDGNTDKYIIEKSVNGVDFNLAATISAAYKENGRFSNSYSFTQDNLSAIRNSGVIYFRIKQVDKDGTTVYTSIKNVRLDGKAFAVNVYPNPVKGFTKLTIDLLEDSRILISITDAGGKQVKSMQVQGFKGANIKDVNLSNLANGNYMMKVQAGADVKSLPMVKVN